MTQKTAPAHSAPTHIVWFVPERENAPWTRIGALWPTKNGNGFNPLRTPRLYATHSKHALGQHRAISARMSAAIRNAPGPAASRSAKIR